MSQYTLSIGAPKDDPDADIYTKMEALDVTRTASSVNSWSASIPYQTDLEDQLLNEIWIYYDDKVIFRGTLESFDVDYDTGTTSIDGRGILSELDRRTDVVTYTDTTVYDALVDWWSNRDWDTLVLPPNRDLFDQRYETTNQLRFLWSWLGDDTTNIAQDNAYVGDDNKLHLTDRNMVLDDTDGGSNANTNQDETIGSTLDTFSSDEIFLLVETEDAVDWINGGMKQMQSTMSDDPIETLTHNVTHNTPQHIHLFRFKFASDHDKYRPFLEIGDYTTAITRCEVFVPDQSGYSTIDSVDLEGTQLDVIQELHDLGGYEFIVDDYTDLNVHSFPVGATAGEPNWQITSADRSLDYTNYANKVTVVGATDGGTTNTATRQNDDEIAEMQSRGVDENGIVEKFEKNPDVVTQSEVDSRAEKLLSESVQERDEKGSLEITPQLVTPGYSYNVSIWNDVYPQSTKVGDNTLYLDGDSYFRTEGPTNYNPTHVTKELLIHPTTLDELDTNEYQTVLYKPSGTGETYIRVYGDGSVGFDNTYTNPSNMARTDPNVIRNNATQRLSIQWGSSTTLRRVLVDGQVEMSTYNHGYPGFKFESDNFYIGADSSGSHGFVGVIDDFRLWTYGNSTYNGPEDFQTKSQIREWMYSDLALTGTDTSKLNMYYRFEDPENGPWEAVGSYQPDNEFVNVDVLEQRGRLDEISYSLGSGDTASLNFDITGRIDTELVSTQKSVKRNRRTL